MKVYLANAFSLNMLPRDVHAVLYVSPISYDRFINDIADYLIRHDVEFVCAIGHKSTAEMVKMMLEYERPIAPREELNCERREIQLTPGDLLYVIQIGFRIPEGKVYNVEELKELMEQKKITFWMVHYRIL